MYNGLFTLPDPDWDSDSKPDWYFVLCRSFYTGSDLDQDPYLDGFPNGYCTQFRDGSPSQGQISTPILLHFNQGIRVRIRTNGKFLHSTVIHVRVGIRVQSLTRNEITEIKIFQFS